MRYLVSLSKNTVNSFHKLSSRSEEEWYCTSDPVGEKVGSGGGPATLSG